MQKLEQMLTTVDISEMMGMSHKNVLRKIDGREIDNKHAEGIIDILNELQLEPVEYFVESYYIDSKGEKRKCYNVTRKGCEFLAHKFQGKKGIVFTARYIERFHQMEEIIKSGIAPADPVQEPPVKDHVPELPEIPTFHGNFIGDKETAALFIKRYITENGDNFGVYRAYKNNQMEHSDVILPYNMFRRVQIRTEEMIRRQAMA